MEKCFVSGIPFSAMEMITPSYHTKKGRVGKYYLLLEYFSYCERDKKNFYNKLNEYTKNLPVVIIYCITKSTFTLQVDGKLELNSI